ncbi:MAG TPA: mechanosensitive ion channel family protein [Terracidiphilus sp.]|nr:mechanosensitive ion channel family protein [Terracidiphilus sp.]
MFRFMLAARWSWFSEGRFLGRVLDEWANDTQEFVRNRLPHLLVVAVIAFILSRLLRLFTRRMTRVAEQHAAGPGRIAQVKTVSQVIRATGLTVIGVITGLQFLDAVGINLGPLLASAGIAGVAIGLAAQNIVKDVLNGILILVEDQFNVGDMVRIAGLAGTVEAMTLRKTTVRDADGTLYVVPNSQITTVANLSVGYSVATVNVSVDFSANPDQVQKLLTSIAMDIRKSDEFRQLFVADPQILGVDAIKGSELIFPVVFKTLATKQYGPIREFRRRVRLALEEHHLLPGNPYRVFNTFGEQDDASQNVPVLQPAPEDDPTLLKPQNNNPFSES